MGIRMHTVKRTGSHAHAHFESFRSEIRSPVPNGDNGIDGVFSGIYAKASEAHETERTDIRGAHLVGDKGIDGRLAKLINIIRAGQSQNFGRIHHALHMLAKPEYG